VPVGEDLLEDKYSGISANLASYVGYDLADLKTEPVSSRVQDPGVVIRTLHTRM